MSTNNQKKISSLIDQLVKMSGVKDDISTIDIEREGVEEELSQPRASLDSLKTLISPERYCNANEAIVNNAIESSLMRRNSALEVEIKSKKTRIEEIRKSLSELEVKASENQENLSRSMKCIDALSARINESDSLDSDTLAHYESMISKTKGSLVVFEGEDEKIQEQMAKLRAEIDQIENEIRSLQAIIDTNNSYLFSAKNSTLESDGQGVALKERDEKEVKLLEEKIANLEAKRIELLENPVILAAKAKAALQEETDVTTLIGIVRKLVENVSRKEFMNVPYDEKFEEEMQAKLQSAEEERNSFAAEIEGKVYKSDNTELDLRRKSFLEDRIKFYQESIATIRDIINQIDTKGGLNNSSEVEAIESAIADMQKTLSSYSDIETTTTLRKSEIIAATNKKEQQIEEAKDLVAAYQSDVIADVNLAAQFETQTISNLELAIANARAELNAIESRLNLQKNAPEDFVAKAIDEARLKELAATVIAIKYRNKFKESPSQILEEIEAILGTTLEPISVTELPAEEKEATLSFEDLATNTGLDTSKSDELEKTLGEGNLKVDHILDLAKDYQPSTEEIKKEPEITFEPIDISQTNFEPITPIELDSYVPSSNTEASKVDFSTDEEPTRGHKVIDMTPIEIEEPKMDNSQAKEEVPVVKEQSTNPFASNDESHLFDFNGDLLKDENPELDNIIDFNQAVNEINTLGLGRTA